MKSLITALTILFVSNQAISGLYITSYAKIDIDKDETQTQKSSNSYATILLGYRTTEDVINDNGDQIGFNADIFTTGDNVSYAAGVSYKRNHQRYAVGITRPNGIKGSEGIYLGFINGWFAMRYIIYTTEERGTGTLVKFNKGTVITKKYTTLKETDRTMLWVGVTREF